MKKLIRSCMALFIGLAFAFSAVAQTNRGGISGSVTDKTGGVIVGAIVTITNVGTNETYHAATSRQGTYSVQNLDPVTYKVEVEVPGFRRAIVEKVKVDTASVETVNLVLEPGNVATEVQVSGQAPLVNAENATLGQTISERMLTDVPLLNRSVLDLAVVTPNVTGDVGSEDPVIGGETPVPGFNLSANGGRPGSTYMIADGVSNTGVGIAREVVAFSPETVQELTVQTSSYSAAFGHTGGGVINVTTKSGTNQYHGAATVYHRNPATNAAPWSNATTNRPKSNLRYTQMSFTLGGPVVIPKLYNGHNRTFFFWAFEPRYQSDASQGDTLLPTDAMRNGDFSSLTNVVNGWAPTDIVNRFQSTLPPGRTLLPPSPQTSTIYQVFTLVSVNGKQQLQGIPLGSNPNGCGAGFTTYCPFAGNILPAAFVDPVAQKILQLMPKAGPYFINGNGDLANFVTMGTLKNDQKRYLLRLDQVFTDKNRAFFRYTDVPVIGVRGGNGAIRQTEATYGVSHQYTVSDTQIFSPTMYNDVRFNYTYGRFSGTFSPEFDIASGRNLSTELGLPTLTKGGLPLFTFGGAANRRTNGGDIGAGSSQINDNSETQYQLVDNLFITHGNMTWTIGLELSRKGLNTLQYNFASGGRYGFRYFQTTSNGGSSGEGGIVFASFLEGAINDNLLATSLVPYSYQYQGAATFVQNDWKVRPNLTLNLGLRYSLQGPRTEAHDLQGYYLPDRVQIFPILDSKGNPTTLKTVNGLTLPTAISSVPTPGFGYSGIAGNSRYQTPINWADFEPRFGFAYTPHLFGLNKFVVRGGYGLSHVPLTGQNRQPNPNFGGPGSLNAVDSTYAMRLSTNPPNLVPQTPQQAVGVTNATDGLQFFNSINIPASILSSNTKTPYVQNWNFSISRELGANTVVEVAYVGAKGTHLFLPPINMNQFDPNWVAYLEANGLQAFNTKMPDPLGRCVPGAIPTVAGSRCSGNGVLQVPIGTLYSPFPGFSNVFLFDNASADSIRHAGYVSVVHRQTRGMTWSTNYTYGKSIDDASNGSPDKNLLTSSNLPGGQITFGGTPRGDRAVSTYDVKHALNFVGVYDLPFGHGRRFFADTWKPADLVIGGWTISGVERFYSGFPAVVTQAFANDRGTTVTHDIRPNVNPGVPIINPAFDPKCPIGSLCEPYINPSAFMEAPIGQLGNAPRTFDAARGPWQQTLDLSVQKNFQVTERVRIQLRVDALNALNHPIFRVVPNNFAGTDIFGGGGGGLNTGSLNTSDYNNWAAANGQPVIPAKPKPGDPGVALRDQINTMINSQRIPPPPGSNPGALGRLPADFFTVALPQGITFMNANSFDIRTLSGYKLYRVRQDLGTGSGRFYAPPQSARYLQFGLRLFF
ncbi:MAG TPA: carboxypeptidase regulatory-like domain-containing protein [Candidatus Dormibacteraeota bacterium]|nr:carboxypeptidase regulatory-like domain-containing protein [Candidatus Dormibacteraeota bacterium]